MSKLPVPTSMIQSSAKVDPNTLHMLRRTQGEGEKQLDIQELQNCKVVKTNLVLPSTSVNQFLKKYGIQVGGEKHPDNHPENEVRFMSSPIIDEREIELDNFATQDEVGDDEFNGDEDMNIDGATGGTSEKKRVRGKQHVRIFMQEVLKKERRWHAVLKDIKQRMWEYVNSKFLIPAEREKWVMTGLRDAWKRHKKNIKKKYFDKNATIDEMLQNRPIEIPEVQFCQLIEYWDDEDVQAMCQLNSENRKKQMWTHRMGPINFAIVRVALRATKENNEEPSKSEMFITTRTKKGKEVHTDTQVAIVSHAANLTSFDPVTYPAVSPTAEIFSLQSNLTILLVTFRFSGFL
ncbi:PREDICTED: uncharacterized protein LOC109216585 [Nicotiana attenuata]|uniref:uncharacterized protein LOC109216585 n=1 Tax=Nicotiana attenuata TaxID=49451 RepID=UPI00090461F5|nr:PREDICTED: uncharacterized protein LOC109216585 [Nicotiana attenuata]